MFPILHNCYFVLITENSDQQEQTNYAFNNYHGLLFALMPINVISDTAKLESISAGKSVLKINISILILQH